MPTYEYECQRCGHAFDAFQSISEAPLKRCPKCRGKIKRLVGSGAGFIFKGSGFYQTDYRSQSYKKAQAAEKPSTDTGKKPDTGKAPVSTTPGKTEKSGS